MQLEWAERVCRRWQLRMVVGTALSLLPLRSSSSSCSSRASLLQEREIRLYQNAATADFIFGSHIYQTHLSCVCKQILVPGSEFSLDHNVLCL